jgi:hypothetical protein
MWRDRARPDPLWLPVVAPVIWSTHFTVCYIWAALACGRFSARAAATIDSTLTTLTVMALVAIGLLFVRAWRQLGYTLPDRPNDDGTPEDRNTFMSYTTMLLAGLSGIATLYVGVAAISIGGCR